MTPELDHEILLLARDIFEVYSSSDNRIEIFTERMDGFVRALE